MIAGDLLLLEETVALLLVHQVGVVAPGLPLECGLIVLVAVQVEAVFAANHDRRVSAIGDCREQLVGAEPREAPRLARELTGQDYRGKREEGSRPRMARGAFSVLDLRRDRLGAPRVLRRGAARCARIRKLRRPVDPRSTRSPEVDYEILGDGGGTVIQRQLEGEMLRVDTGCIVAFTTEATARSWAGGGRFPGGDHR